MSQNEHGPRDVGAERWKVGRRSLLAGVGLAAAALALPRTVFGQPGEPAPTPLPTLRKRGFRFAHLTDIHVQPERKAGSGMAACLRSVGAMKDRPGMIITGGDLVMDSFGASETRTRTQWDLFTKTLKDECAIPVEHTIGNHDIWGWNNAKSGCKGDEPGYGKRWVTDTLGMSGAYRSFERGGWKVIILDSVQERGDKYVGRLDDTQMEWLGGELKSAGATPVAIVSHIPIISACPILSDADQADENFKLSGASVHSDSRKLVKLFGKHPCVKLCVSGHIHILERLELQGVTYICDGAVSGTWWRGREAEPKDDKPSRSVEGYGVFDLFDDGTFGHEYVTYGWQAAPKD
jgi:3',5'-cyclic AMP phosphodiesterase CpdA